MDYVLQIFRGQADGYGVAAAEASIGHYAAILAGAQQPSLSPISASFEDVLLLQGGRQSLCGGWRPYNTLCVSLHALVECAAHDGCSHICVSVDCKWLYSF